MVSAPALGDSGESALGRDSSEGAFTLRQIGQLLLFATATWTATYSRFTTGPLQEALHQSLSISDNRMAILQGSAVAIPMVLGAIPIGFLGDRVSRKNMLLVATFLVLISLVLCVTAPSYERLLLARVLLGLSMGGMLVPAYAMGGDLVSPAQRGRATMAIMIGEISGGSAAFAIGGALLVYVSAAPALTVQSLGLANWAWTLLWMSAVVVIALALFTLIREPARRDVIVARPPLRTVLPELWKYRRVAVPLQLGRATFLIGDGAVLVWGAPLFARKFHLAADRIGFIMAIALLVGGAVGVMLGGVLVDYCQRRPGGSQRAILWLAGIAALTVPASLFSLASNAEWAAVLLTLFLTLGFCVSAVTMALTLIVIPGELRALNLGVTLIVGSVFAVALAPLAVSALSGVLGGEGALPQSLAIVSGIATLANALVFAFSARYFPTHRV
jgi:MFS family permease